MALLDSAATGLSLDLLFQMIRILPLLPLLAAIGWLVYTRFFHPLSGVPGPLLASITRLWYVHKVRQGSYDAINRDLHAHYGPLVRIAPDEVSISDPEAVHKVYSIKDKFTKSDFYPAWAPQGIDTPHGNIFTDLDETHHGSRRRLLAHIYSMSAILESEHYIDNSTSMFVTKLSEIAAESKSMDLGAWLQFYAFDALGELCYGSAFGFLETGSDYGNWIETLDKLLPTLVTISVLPLSYRTPYLMTSALSAKMRKHLEKAGALVAYAKDRVQKRQEAIDETGNERKDILQKCIQLHRTKGEKEDYRLEDIQMESYVNLLAGSDTTAIAMQAIFWHLLAHPKVLEKLLAELDGSLKAGKLTLPVKYADALKLTYFSACMKEATRLHPSVGLQMPRHPPAEGAEISGYYFPKSTRVGINAAVLHYDKSIFGEDANEFNPDRWLGKDAAHMDVSEIQHIAAAEGKTSPARCS